jgi:tetratricopeptide (TPR) repeat protein
MQTTMSTHDILHTLFGRRETTCPNEADVLAYSESRLSARNRGHLERHFAGCDDCRELLVFLARESAEAYAPLSNEAVSEQTDKVLSLIRHDELNRGKQKQRRQTRRDFYPSYPKLAAAALMLCTIAISAIVFLTSGPTPAESAMQALAIAVKDARFTEARVSGGLGYSPYSVNRGVGKNDNELQFNRAIANLKSAGQNPASVSERLVLARVYLARGTPEEAWTILGELEMRGVETSEALNDMGVAQFEMGKYEEAISYFTRALAKSPSYSEALFNKALAEERAHHNDQAREDWRQFISVSSDENWKAEASKHLR